jgi:catechol 2,3-dioxygenase-like lactoylglutathione lyase family enzyme
MNASPKLIPELKVTDFEKSLAFYGDIAGFTVLYERKEEAFAMLEKEGSQIMIEALTDQSRTWKVGALEHPFGRGMHFQIEVSDVDTLYQKIKEAEWPIFHNMEEKWYRVNEKEEGNRQFLVQDPDGYLLRFFTELKAR